MWTRNDVVEGALYRLWLCSEGGYRRVRIARDGEVPPGGLFYTPIVSSELLQTLDLERISEEVALVDGVTFVVDAHGLWYVKAEYEALRRRVGFANVPWVTGAAPKLAPK